MQVIGTLGGKRVVSTIPQSYKRNSADYGVKRRRQMKKFDAWFHRRTVTQAYLCSGLCVVGIATLHFLLGW